MSGSVEALEDALLKIDVGEEVELRVIDRGVGAITRTTSTWPRRRTPSSSASTSRPRSRSRELADREGVDIRYYSVIYQAIEDIEAALKGMLKPEYEEVAARHRRGPRGLPVLQVRQHRRLPGALRRDPAQRQGAAASATASSSADNLTIDSLRRFKDDATEVREGYECGIGLGSFNDIKVDDVIETFEMREKPRA